MMMLSALVFLQLLIVKEALVVCVKQAITQVVQQLLLPNVYPLLHINALLARLMEIVLISCQLHIVKEEHVFFAKLVITLAALEVFPIVLKGLHARLVEQVTMKDAQH